MDLIAGLEICQYNYLWCVDIFCIENRYINIYIPTDIQIIGD